MVDPIGSGFGKFVPGFDFLQNLTKQASQNIPQMPNLSNWVAPTLNVEELDKRIEELKTVQFWLDQNAKALSAVIQALEVQKMTLATLKGMNFNMGDVANAFKLKAADTVMGSVTKAVDTARGLSGVGKTSGVKKKKTKAGAAASGAMPDPLQWWGALTKQFGDIAASSMKDAAVDTTRNMATGLAKGAVQGAMKAATGAANSMTKAAAGAAGSMAALAAKKGQPDWSSEPVASPAPRVANSIGARRAVSKAPTRAPAASRKAPASKKVTAKRKR